MSKTNISSSTSSYLFQSLIWLLVLIGLSTGMLFAYTYIKANSIPDSFFLILVFLFGLLSTIIVLHIAGLLLMQVRGNQERRASSLKSRDKILNDIYPDD